MNLINNAFIPDSHLEEVSKINVRPIVSFEKDSEVRSFSRCSTISDHSLLQDSMVVYAAVCLGDRT